MWRRDTSLKYNIFFFLINFIVSTIFWNFSIHTFDTALVLLFWKMFDNENLSPIVEIKILNISQSRENVDPLTIVNFTSPHILYFFILGLVRVMNTSRSFGNKYLHHWPNPMTLFISRIHIYQTNAFVCLRWIYVDGIAKANERWRMPSFAFGNVPSDVGHWANTKGYLFSTNDWVTICLLTFAMCER